MTLDQQREEWEAFEASQLAKRICPYGGDVLEARRGSEDGPLDPDGDVLACGVCDCFGFHRDDERIGREDHTHDGD